jgi:hypothetical protein
VVADVVTVVVVTIVVIAIAAMRLFWHKIILKLNGLTPHYATTQFTYH